MATGLRFAPLDDVGLCDLLQRVPGMSRLPDLPRKLPAMRGGFFKPSLDGGLLLFVLVLSS